MPGEGSRPSKQRREVGAVEMDFLGFADADQPAEGGQ